MPCIEEGTFDKEAVVGSLMDHGTRLRYTCSGELIQAGSKWIECNNGTWSAIPKCISGNYYI